MKRPIIVPEQIMPKPLPWRNCECMKHPVDLKEKKGTLTWLKAVGDSVSEGEVICEGEADKKRWKSRLRAAVCWQSRPSKTSACLRPEIFWAISKKRDIGKGAAALTKRR